MKQYSDFIKLAIAMLDLALLVAAFLTAFQWRFGKLDWAAMQPYIWLLYVSAPVGLLFMLRYGVLTGYRYRTLPHILFNTFRAFVWAGVICAAVLFLTKSGWYSRLFFGAYFALGVAFVVAEKIAVKSAYDAYLRRGGMGIAVILLGYGERLEEIRTDLTSHPNWGIRIVGELDPRRLSVDRMFEQIKNSVADEIYIAYPRDELYHRQIDALLRKLEQYGLPLKIALNFDEIYEYYGQHPCKMSRHDGILLAPYNLDPDQRILKRLLDIAGSLVGLLITVLLFPGIALAVKLDSRGPVIFSQTRVGKGGRRFRLYKFRSMRQDAEAVKARLLQENIHEGPIFKLENDPRITRSGRFLRKYSLDELPQFWNVLKGDMSLVGTRPPTVDEVDQYADWHYRRISIKPGLTGLWQVSGRNRVKEFDQIVQKDIEYIKNWSLGLDLWLILKTVGVVLFPDKSGGV
ncbi:MAG: sugar transferase [Methylothermaceae bacterium]|nr:sugar transferase [Methylothermaceae bacterium]